MKPVRLDLCLKGDRDYLSGADLYAALVARLDDYLAGLRISHFRLAFHGFARKQVEMCFAKGRLQSEPQNLVGKFALTSEADEFQGWLTETDVPIGCRYPYLEENIHGLCVINGRSVRIESRSGFSSIEEVVSMTKLLHNRLFPSSDKRWVFSRIDLNRLLRPADAGNLEVKLEQALATRITRSRILSGGSVIGSMFFSVA